MTNDLNALEDSVEFEIKKSIKLKTCVESTHVFVLALEKTRNKLTSIIYKEKGTPIAGYVYDAKFGQYYVECADYLDLGTIPISFSIQIDKINRWECRIPLTECVIKNYLDEQQITVLENFKIKNKDCKFDFMQFLSCY